MRAATVLLPLLLGCGRMGFEAQSGRETVRITAVVAECLNPDMPSMTGCTEANGSGQLVVDAEDGATKSPWESFLKFALDDQLAGRTVDSVTLVMTSTDDGKAAGPDSGAVFEVAAFDRTSLATGAPAQVRVAPLAASKGRVEQDEVVQWDLPASTVTGAAVHLGIFVTSDDDGGVNYWNLDGAEPPRLDIVVF